MADYEISIAPRMADIDRAEWDALAGAYGSPLLSWGCLALLEESGSIRPETGWTPVHLLVREKGGTTGSGPHAAATGASAGAPAGSGGRLVAAAPFYVKTHSWGEFVFDFQFAEVAQRAGARWYPKLVGMVPATPAPAWRVLTAAGEDASELTRLVLDAAVGTAREAGLGGVHILWPDLDLGSRLLPAGPKERRWSRWDHQSFLWTDEGYGDFAGYLDSFSKNMRRNVKRERASLRSAGVATRMIGPEEARAAPGLLSRMAELYEAHNDKFGPWGAKFLTPEFFLLLPEYMETGWALSAAFAERGSPFEYEGSAADPLALAFLFEGRDRLYGRYYGTRAEVGGLHFELCYYLPIEYALERGIASFDPGMGSPHKARRGFRSMLAPSFHLPFDRRLADLMARALPDFNDEEAAAARTLDEELPFKRG